MFDTGNTLLALEVTVGRAPVTIVAGAMGLMVGSFLNVVVFRVPRHLSVVKPPSFCPRCHAHVGAIDNVPVLSWLALRGKCRHCGEPISPRYPVVEGATGVVFASLGWVIGPHVAVLGCCALAATVLALVVIALDGLVPPLSVALVGVGIGTALLVGAGAVDHRWGRLVTSLVGLGVGAVVIGIATFAAHLAHHEIDSKGLAAALPAGALVGWAGPLAAGVAAASAVIIMGALCVWRGRHQFQKYLLVNMVLALSAGGAIAVAVAAAFGRLTGT